ncbi:uncharacterized protein LOC114740152 [Neltuma alba]|uniref:uncharacterized protein LOC114740152 n=1 Tax=Neltuma alba TaxID=207710 RepID=UPI0010A49072|nr:uncharacterized protein LOC114740152 [Prosopis alba]
MYNFQRFKSTLCLSGTVRKSPTSRCFRLSQHYPLPAFSLGFGTIASPGDHSFTVSYLVNNLGFSQEAALNASKRVRFDTSQKPDAVVSFFESQGFSKSMMKDVLRKNQWLLNCDPQNRILPKFEFFLSKGASASDIVLMVQRNARFLERSLTNHIIPSYELLKEFLQDDKTTIDCIKRYSAVLHGSRVMHSINMLLKKGVSGANIAIILHETPRVLNFTNELERAVEELKSLGFNPSATTFGAGLTAKVGLSKSKWEAKVEVYKRWGWSEEAVLKAFRTDPRCMLAGKDKINAVMSFWVNQLGWNSLLLLKRPTFIGFSLKKRIIPRASVLQFLYSKGLVKKNASVVRPFVLPEKQFLERYVKCFKEHDHKLIKLYEENMKDADMSCS